MTTYVLCFSGWSQALMMMEVVRQFGTHLGRSLVKWFSVFRVRTGNCTYRLRWPTGRMVPRRPYVRLSRNFTTYFEMPIIPVPAPNADMMFTVELLGIVTPNGTVVKLTATCLVTSMCAFDRSLKQLEYWCVRFKVKMTTNNALLSPRCCLQVPSGSKRSTHHTWAYVLSRLTLSRSQINSGEEFEAIFNQQTGMKP